MRIKILNSMKRHDHWFAEWWSAVLLMIVGIYGIFASDSFIIQQSFIDGFLQFFPVNMWKMLFIGIGFFQLCMLRNENFIGRGIAAFLASTLLIWGFLNILVYGQWHFSLIAWSIFSAINLYALSRIVRGIERNYESF